MVLFFRWGPHTTCYANSCLVVMKRLHGKELLGTGFSGLTDPFQIIQPLLSLLFFFDSHILHTCFLIFS